MASRPLTTYLLEFLLGTTKQRTERTLDMSSYHSAILDRFRKLHQVSRGVRLQLTRLFKVEGKPKIFIKLIQKIFEI